MEAPPVVVCHPGADPAPWAASLPAVQVVPLDASNASAARAALVAAGCALVDGTQPEPVALARRVVAVDDALQVAIVAPRREHSRIQRVVLFSPGLGEVWVVAPDEVGPGLVERASGVTRQRRAYRTMQLRVEHALAGIEPHSERRAVVSDAYLAALLAVLPDPVLSIDGGGRIVTWSAAAERAFGQTRRDAVGKRLAEMLDLDGGERLADVLEAAAGDARTELRYRAVSGETRTAELTVVPVEAAGHRVRVVLLHDITEERRALQAAERARVEAEAANRAKSDFLATMSHEIRTPINAITGYAEILALGISGPVTDKQVTQIGRIRASSQHLLMLVEDILDLARVEAGRLEVARERALAADAVVEAVTLVGPQATAAGVEIEARLGGGEPEATYVGDDDRVRQILVNLLSNAVKFTAAGGRILVEHGPAGATDAAARARPGRWTYIRVQDTGIGIRPADVEKIFLPFEQVEEGHTRTRGGAGLGLSISRQLARLMGGDLTVVSEPGRGSTFTLWLPTERREDLVAAPPVAEEGDEHARVLERVGRVVREETGRVLDTLVARLAGDPAVPDAASLGRDELENHTATFLVDVARTLSALAASAPEPANSFRDGSAIQRTVAELHGAQRARLGWDERAVKREFEILREIVAVVVAERLPDGGAPVHRALEVIYRLLEEAEQYSVRRFLRTAR